MDRVDLVTDRERELAEKYGFQLRSDDSGNVKIFSPLRSLNEHVQRQRTI